MSDILRPEDQERANKLVSSGRFPDVEAVLQAGLDALEDDDEWRSYAQDRIAAGLADVEAGHTIPLDEFLARLRTHRLQKA